MNPLVSVICLCYNHQKYLLEAINSVLDQSYKEIELIIVDDCSTDSSRELLRKLASDFPQIRLLENEVNRGNCKSFNKALALSKGKYIIDFATDDVMFPNRIQKQVESFEKLGKEYGVLFTNALNIDESGRVLYAHFKEQANIPSGDIYKTLLEKYLINPPTMMMKKSVLDQLGGYDESLHYEDFDFWVRSSRDFKYFYLNEILTQRRIVGTSHSAKFYQKKSQYMAESTYRVIEKARWLNKNKEENESLQIRIQSELRLAFYMENFMLVRKYGSLLKLLDGETVLSKLICFLSLLKVPVFSFYKIYLKIKPSTAY